MYAAGLGPKSSSDLNFCTIITQPRKRHSSAPCHGHGRKVVTTEEWKF